MTNVATTHVTTTATNAPRYSGAACALGASPPPPVELVALLREAAPGVGAGARRHSGIVSASKSQYDTRKMSAVLRPRAYSTARLSIAHACGGACARQSQSAQNLA